jgi:hypothetical protein
VRFTPRVPPVAELTAAGPNCLGLAACREIGMGDGGSIGIGSSGIGNIDSGIIDSGIIGIGG